MFLIVNKTTPSYWQKEFAQPSRHPRAGPEIRSRIMRLWHNMLQQLDGRKLRRHDQMAHTYFAHLPHRSQFGIFYAFYKFRKVNLLRQLWIQRVMQL